MTKTVERSLWAAAVLAVVVFIGCAADPGDLLNGADVKDGALQALTPPSVLTMNGNMNCNGGGGHGGNMNDNGMMNDNCANMNDNCGNMNANCHHNGGGHSSHGGSINGTGARGSN